MKSRKVPQIVMEGENGFLLSAEARSDTDAEVISRIFRDDKRYAELVRASRDAFEERLNWDAWGITVKQILTDLIDNENSDKKIDQPTVQLSKIT